MSRSLVVDQIVEGHLFAQGWRRYPKPPLPNGNVDEDDQAIREALGRPSLNYEWWVDGQRVYIREIE
jgi:hypothetical protein